MTGSALTRWTLCGRRERLYVHIKGGSPREGRAGIASDRRPVDFFGDLLNKEISLLRIRFFS